MAQGSEYLSIRNGTGEKTFSNGSAEPILIFRYGTSAQASFLSWQ